MSPAGILASVLTCATIVQAPVRARVNAEANITTSEQQRFDQCDRLRGELRQKSANDPRALHDAWLAAKPRCAGTGIYEYLLGHDEQSAGNSAAAATIFEDMVKRKLPYHEEAFVMLNTMRGEAAMQSQPPDLKRIGALRDELAEFAGRSKPSAFTYQQLAAVNVTLRDWPAAIDAARKSNEVNRMYGLASRYLVLALHQSDRCPEVVQEMKPALAHSRELFADRDFMLPVADCLAQTGDPRHGEEALQALLREKPALKDDPQVLQMQHYFAVTNRSGSR